MPFNGCCTAVVERREKNVMYYREDVIKGFIEIIPEKEFEDEVHRAGMGECQSLLRRSQERT